MVCCDDDNLNNNIKKLTQSIDRLNATLERFNNGAVVVPQVKYPGIHKRVKPEIAHMNTKKKR